MKISQLRFSAIVNLKIVIPVLILLFAAAGAFAMIKTAPRANKRPPVAVLPTVETASFEKGPRKVRLAVMGTVLAAKEITLESLLAGEVLSVSDTFMPGGYFESGQEILRIDPQDYKLAISEIRAEVTEAEYNLKIELGYQTVAGREWELLKQTTLDGTEATAQESDLALRKPHLEKAKADLAAAKAKLRQAQLDLERTTITAPFAAIVASKSTDVGASVSTQEALATLVGTDEFWVRVSVPVDRLNWITFPAFDGSGGTTATVVNGDDSREGRVIRLLPALEDEGRMARVLISIPDPLNLAGDPALKPLLIGSYVNVLIDGGEIADAYDIPRTALRDDNKLWVLTEDGCLDIRDVSPIWRDADSVILSAGLAEGELVVTSALSAPTQGMKLQTYRNQAQETAPNTQIAASEQAND